MKRTTLVLILIGLLIAACSGAGNASVKSPGNSALLITAGDKQVQFTLEDLQSMEDVQASFLDVDYRGVLLSTVLKAAGVDPLTVKAVKAIAADGFSANYDPTLVNKEDTLVAFARLDGPLADDEGPLRMVLPGQEGKLNVRQLVEIQVIQ